MWIATTIGFYSVVQKPSENRLTIRSRSKADLLRIKETVLPEMSEIQSGGGTDYPYRAWCQHDQWAKALALLAQDIDYPNFKSEVKKQRGAVRARIYSQVWEVLWDIFDLDDHDSW